jgi:hypothetical protein
LKHDATRYRYTVFLAIAALRIPLWLLSGSGCRVGVFPQGEEIAVGDLGFDVVTRDGVGTTDVQPPVERFLVANSTSTG